MLPSKILRPVLVLAGAVALAGGCVCLPGGEPPATCSTGGTITLDVPTTICLPDAGSRVSLTFSPALAGDTVVTVTCDAGDSDLLVDTEASDNSACGSFNGQTTATRTITAAENSIEFGVNPYINGGVAPGEATVTVSAATATL